MTAGELSRLAEIAGFNSTVISTFHDEDGVEVPIEVYCEDSKESLPVILWQPHLRIDQALMVVEAFTAFYVGKDSGQYFCRLAVTNGDWIKYLPKVHSTSLPLAICRAALAAVKE